MNEPNQLPAETAPAPAPEPPPAPSPPTLLRESQPRAAPAPSSPWQTLKKVFLTVAAVLFIGLKFLGKLKFLVLPALKFFPLLLKTGGTMLLSIWFYAMNWGWMFAVGFVLLIFVHECGHLLAAKRIGLKVGAPVFIPFLGAFIALKEAPRNAWIEAQVGLGGPLLGTLGAVLSEMAFQLTGNSLFRVLAYTGFFLNLFNLAPIGFLDGGRIVTALSPWLWVAGLVIVGGMMVLQPNFILLIILLVSLPRLYFLFRRKTDEERRYFEVTPGQRWFMAVFYFGLVVFLVLGMRFTHVPPPPAG